ncbi:nucleoside phosphorylase domain-containing protein [Aspergillus pseudoustus]|uniref:Nucleoside phosphorylase domain-containing protein n=1 Tax=Aspergillus pseudoustus TaxID=1810923 RepID=A0ABR4ILV0_9EURO
MDRELKDGSTPLKPEDYTVGWVCALPIELAASLKMLDETHPSLQQPGQDSNVYTLGRIDNHNVVMACLPKGSMGAVPAAEVAVQMRMAFPSIRFGLMVGIGGGVPSPTADIRLGDVVVSKQEMGRGGVIQYDYGKTRPEGFKRTGSLNAPPTVLLNALNTLEARRITGESALPLNLSRLRCLTEFDRDSAGHDDLFEASYIHTEDGTCDGCDKGRLVKRSPRASGPVVHYGTIASGNQVMRDAVVRDRLSAELDGVLCFEMEAAGLMNSFPCLVIRGISDYADSHKNKSWQGYAAATAAAFSREILAIIPTEQVLKTPVTGKGSICYRQCGPRMVPRRAIGG